MVGLRCFDKKVHWTNIGHENIKTLETFRSGSSVWLECLPVTVLAYPPNVSYGLIEYNMFLLIYI